MGPSGKAVEYEQSDAKPRVVALLAAGGALFIVLSPFVLHLLFPESLRLGLVVAEVTNIPGPRLQMNPQQDLAAFRQAEEKRLAGYGWVNRERKAVHMPIDRALRLTLERGLPGWSKP